MKGALYDGDAGRSKGLTVLSESGTTNQIAFSDGSRGNNEYTVRCSA